MKWIRHCRCCTAIWDWLTLAFRHDLPKALESLERSAESHPDSQTLLELDQLYEQSGTDPAKRLAMLESHQELVNSRHNVLAREAGILVRLGRYDRALEVLASRQFYRWEGEGSAIHDTFVAAHLLRGHQHFEAGRFQEALRDYEAASEFPLNLQAGYSPGALARVHYFIARAYAAAGEGDSARKYYQTAIADAKRLKDQSLRAWATTHFYSSMALKQLGETNQARVELEGMLDQARKSLKASTTDDVYAKFDEQNAPRKSQALAHFVMGLAQLGLDRPAEARDEFRQTLALEPDHVEARWRETRLAEEHGSPMP